MRRSGGIVAFGVAVLCGGRTAWGQAEPAPEITSVGASSLLSASVGAGARALGMGGAFIAVADDATAASWNPAGLSVLDRPEVSIVWSPSIRLSTQYPRSIRRSEFVILRNGETSSASRDEYLNDPSAFSQSGDAVDFASATYRFKVRGLRVVPQVSFQRAIPLGLASSSRETWRRTSSSAVRDPAAPPTDPLLNFTIGGQGTNENRSTTRGGVDVYALSVGVGLSDRASVGLSLNVWRGSTHGTASSRRDEALIFESTQIVSPPYATQTDSDISDRYRGFNAVVGALFRPSRRWRVGAVFKSPFSMKRTVTLRSETIEELLETTTLRHVNEDGTIAWPGTLGLGLAFLPFQALTLSADFTQSGWRTASYQFVSRTQRESRFGNGEILLSTTEGIVLTKFPSLYAGGITALDDRLDQVDTRQLRFGAEYVVQGVRLAGLKVVPLRAGLFFEQPSVKDTFRNEPARLTGLTAGVGLTWSHLSVDVAYVRVSGRFFSRDHRTEFDFSLGSTRLQSVDEIASEGEDRFTSHRFYISAIIKP